LQTDIANLLKAAPECPLTNDLSNQQNVLRFSLAFNVFGMKLATLAVLLTAVAVLPLKVGRYIGSNVIRGSAGGPSLPAIIQAKNNASMDFCKTKVIIVIGFRHGRIYVVPIGKRQLRIPRELR